MPLGAIGVLVLRESLLNGLRAGALAAAGVAFVDLVYCALAATLGAVLAPVIGSWGSGPGILSGLVLIGLGGYQLRNSRHTATADAAAEVPQRAIFFRFVALTAINPLTLLYFFALASWLSAASGSVAAAVGFVLAAGSASLLWQLGLAVAGRMLRAIVSDSATGMLALVASAVVITLGVVVVVTTLAAASS